MHTIRARTRHEFRKAAVQLQPTNQTATFVYLSGGQWHRATCTFPPKSPMTFRCTHIRTGAFMAFVSQQAAVARSLLLSGDRSPQARDRIDAARWRLMNIHGHHRDYGISHWLP